MICSLKFYGLCSPSKSRSGHYHSPNELFNLGQQLKSFLRKLSFLIIFFGLALGVARGSCEVDLLCLPFRATIETVESPGASCNRQSIDF
jgi:hypothetical protein